MSKRKLEVFVYIFRFTYYVSSCF